MSILTGVLHQRGALASRAELERLSLSIDRFSTGAAKALFHGRLGMSSQPYSSHERSGLETGPRSDIRGNAVSFDGRLDNYAELAHWLGLHRVEVSDAEIVLSTFERWGEDCFSRFVGDWAVALWSEKEQRLFLARDHAGTRTLYYQRQDERILWSTYLEPFLKDGTRPRLSEQYAACYLACLPIRDLTPYEGVCSVLPGHYLAFDQRGMVQRSHWSPLNTGTIRYKTDAEYEDHFFELFRQAVARRTGNGAQILAQLSGGMDSTSIVCMSDHIRRSSNSDAEILDTLSYFDDSEASLNERPYFTAAESRRGKSGIHLDAAFSQRTFDPCGADDGVYLLPGADSFSARQEGRLFAVMQQGGYQSILSGVGGDEILGGIPDPLPELADYLVCGNLITLARQSLAWSLVDRSPILATLLSTLRYTGRIYLQDMSTSTKLPPWLPSGIRTYLNDFDVIRLSAIRRLGVAPHQLDNACSWWSVMETLPHTTPHAKLRPEYRYPILDKDLVDYVFSIPREQLVRPGRRRSLMRRSLKDIVPPEILERRRKAYQLRAPLNTIAQAYSKLQRLLRSSALADMGFLDGEVLLRELKKTATGDPKWSQALMRAVAFELWLQSSNSQSNAKSPASSLRALHPRLAS